MMMFIDPLERENRTFAIGEPGHWTTKCQMLIKLPTKRFSGLSGTGFRVTDNLLRVEQGMEWDGSTAVPDTDACLLASLVHDLLCAGILDSGHGIWWRWRARRDADTLYTAINKAQGMWSIRAYIRWTGLRLFGWTYTLVNRIRGKI